MKLLLIFLLYTTISLQTLGHPHLVTVISTNENMLSQQRDSNQFNIPASDTNDIPQQTLMNYRLLQLKAQDKAQNGYLSDSLIRPMVDYYRKHNEEEQLSEACYYAGKAAFYAQNYTLALTYFCQALEALPKQSPKNLENDIYTQIGFILLYNHMYPEALEIFTKSRQHNRQIKDSLNMVYNLRNIAETYRNLERPDSALYYYQLAYTLSRKLHRTDLERMIQGWRAGVFFKYQQYDSTRVALQAAMSDIRFPDINIVYGVAADYYRYMGMSDSASCYYQRLLQSNNLHDHLLAYRGLGELALAIGNDKDAAKYLHLSINLADSLRQQNNNSTIYELHRILHYYLYKNEGNQLKKENIQKSLYNEILITALLILILLIIAYTQHVQRTKKRLENRIRELFQNKEISYEQEQQILQKNMERLNQQEQQLSDSNIEDSIIKQQLERQKQEIYLAKCQMEIRQAQSKITEEKLKSNTLYRSLAQKSKSVTGIAQVSSTEWQELEVLLNNCYPGFTDKLHSLYYTFKEDEWKVCLLLKAGFGPSDIGVLTDHPRSSITTYRRRLCQKALNLPNGKPEEWDAFIRSL